jgi:antitoxin ParD1/3/4
MPMVKKSITVTDQQNAWIAAQLAAGHYGNESEVIRELIRERQLREEETASGIADIRARLIAAEQRASSVISAETFLAEIKKDMRGHGRLQD